mgnify:CR=1 FL=1
MDTQIDIDLQILEGIKKIYTVIENLYNRISFKYQITPLQLKILHFLYNQKNRDTNLKRLSLEMYLTSPTISKSVKNLIKKEFLKTYNTNRNQKEKYLDLTDKALPILNELEKEIKKIIKLISKIDENKLKKREIIEYFSAIIRKFLENGYINKANMCNLCIFYDDDRNYCRFLGEILEYKRIGCPDFVEKTFKNVKNF